MRCFEESFLKSRLRISYEADVARASYYRNFDSKEQIIEAAMDDLRDQLLGDVDYDDDEQIFDRENARAGFEKAQRSLPEK